MDSSRRKLIEETFQKALDLPAQQREAELRLLCGADTDLLRKVRSLLLHFETAGRDYLAKAVHNADSGPEDDLPISVGPYRIVRLIGEGGMGIVYEARQSQPNRRIAIKVIRPGIYNRSQLTRFQRESNALGRLRHAGITNVFEAGHAKVIYADGSSIHLPYLAMEMVEGISLLEYVKVNDLDRRSRLELFAKLCDAVQHAHQRQVIHRDLKPSNILVDADGRPTVLDFGVARLRGESDQTQNTHTGDVIGTPRYMSPEQLFGQWDLVDERSDIYSLGILLFELLTGASPFGESDNTLFGLILWHKQGERPDPGKLDPGLRGQLESIIRMAMAEEPTNRYASAEQLARDIRRHLRGSAVIARRENLLGRARRVLKRQVTTLLLLAPSILILGIAAVRFFSADKSPPPPLLASAAQGNTIAIMNFDNLVDPADVDRHGEVVAELLMTALSQYEELTVVSSQRLHDIRKTLADPGQQPTDRSMATEMAEAAHSRWMVLGRIHQRSPTTVMFQIVEVQTGNVLLADRVTGAPDEPLFPLVDRMAAKTIETLGGPRASHAPITSVAQISTNSEEAFRLYLKGIEMNRKQFVEEAHDHFLEALGIDSTFAMAAFRLALVSGGDDWDRYLAHAVRHADHATRMERLYLQAAQAILEGNPLGRLAAFEAVLEQYPDDKYALERLTWFSRPEEAVEYGLRLIELDPLNEIAYNAIAYAYSRSGNLERALWAIDKYIELAPGEPNPFDSLGDIDAQHGRIDAAIDAYSQACAIRPYFSLRKLGDMYVYNGEFDAAAEAYRRFFGSGDVARRDTGRKMLIYLLVYRGRFSEALQMIDAALTVGDMEGSDVKTRSHYLMVRSILMHEIGEQEEALAWMEKATAELQPTLPVDLIETASRFAKIGHADRAAAYLDPLESRLDQLKATDRERWFAVRGEIQMARGEWRAAMRTIQAAPRALDWVNPYTSRFPLMMACFRAGEYERFIALGEPLLSSFDYMTRQQGRMDFPLFAARLPYRMGIAYAATGRVNEARTQLSRFLEIWKEADPVSNEILDARSWLATLPPPSDPSSLATVVD